MRLESPLDDLFRNGTHVKVLRALTELPEGLGASGRELARRAGVSHPAASRALAVLVDVGIVHVERTPAADSFRLNDDHTLTSPVRSLFELEGCLGDELVSLLRERVREMPVKEAFLFGSLAKGESTTRSDVDVAVRCEPDDEARVSEMLEALADEISMRYGNSLHSIIETRDPSRVRGLWAQIREDGIHLVQNTGRPHA